MQANVITEIHNSLGAVIKFLFEPHYFYNEVLSKDEMIGGLRIKQILNKNRVTNDSSITTFGFVNLNSNSSGAINNISKLPIYDSYHSSSTGDFGLHATSTYFYLDRSSESYVDLFDNNETIGYGRVTITHADGSKTINSFSNYNTPSYKDKLPKCYTFLAILAGVKIDSLDPLGTPYAPSSYVGWERGLLENEEILGADNQLKRSTQFLYNHNGYIFKTIKGRKIIADSDPTVWGGLYTTFSVGEYQIISRPIFLTQQIVKEYDMNDASKSNLTTTLFEHPEAYPHLITKKTTILSDSSQYITTYAYPINPLTPIEGPYFLNGAITSSLIESVTTLKNKNRTVTLGANLNIYDKNALLLKTLSFRSNQGVNDFIPHSISLDDALRNKYTADKRYRLVKSFDQYDTLNNLIQETGADGITTSYISGYNNAYTIAKAINSTADKIAFANFESDFSIEQGNWKLISGSIAYGGKTGRHSFIGKMVIDPLPVDDYKVSLWAKGSGTIEVNGIGQTLTSDWALHEWTLTTTSSVSVNSYSGTMDDVKLCPVNAQMVTYTIDGLVGITATSDPNNNTASFEYDEKNRLKITRDQNGNIIQQSITRD